MRDQLIDGPNQNAWEVRMAKIFNITGQRFGRLTAIHYADTTRHKKRRWLCQCDCGNTVIVAANALLKKNTSSCGCLWREKMAATKGPISPAFRHGKRWTPEYRTWVNIKKRCYNPNARHWKDYGGRGIKMCDEWKNDFMAFYRDMAPRPECATIDRIHNDGNYSPENCRWATPKQQGNNHRGNHLLTFNGETHNVTEWAKIRGLTRKAIYLRIHFGWSIERTLNQPLRKTKRSN